MKLPTYFHVREPALDPHTYCVDVVNNDVFIGYSVVHWKDNFNKRTGRNIAFNRMEYAKTKKVAPYHEARVHPVISITLSSVISRVKEILKLKDPIVYLACAGKKGKGRQVIIDRRKRYED